MYKTKNKEYDIYRDLERVKQALTQTAKDMGGKTTDALQQSLGQIKERSTDYIADKPFKFVAFALLSGWTIGYLMQRRKGRYRRPTK